MYYVLMNDETPLGVFDTPHISYHVLAGYFGEFEVISYDDVRDSGIEWVKTIEHSGDERSDVVLHSFTLNQID